MMSCICVLVATPTRAHFEDLPMQRFGGVSTGAAGTFSSRNTSTHVLRGVQVGTAASTTRADPIHADPVWTARLYGNITMDPTCYTRACIVWTTVVWISIMYCPAVATKDYSSSGRGSLQVIKQVLRSDSLPAQPRSSPRVEQNCHIPWGFLKNRQASAIVNRWFLLIGIIYHPW